MKNFYLFSIVMILSLFLGCGGTTEDDVKGNAASTPVKDTSTSSSTNTSSGSNDSVKRESKLTIAYTGTGIGTIDITPKPTNRLSGYAQNEYIYTFPEGAEITLTASEKVTVLTAYESVGNDFLRWEGDINTSDNPVSFIIKSDMKIKAVWEEIVNKQPGTAKYFDYTIRAKGVELYSNQGHGISRNIKMYQTDDNGNKMSVDPVYQNRSDYVEFQAKKYVGSNILIEADYPEHGTLVSYIPITATDDWQTRLGLSNTTNTKLFYVSPLSDLHFRIYATLKSDTQRKIEIIYGSQNDRIQAADAVIMQMFPNLSQNINLNFPHYSYIDMTNMQNFEKSKYLSNLMQQFQSVSQKKYSGSISLLNKEIVSYNKSLYPLKGKDAEILASFFSSEFPSFIVNGDFEDDLDGWQIYESNKVSGINTDYFVSYQEDGTKSLRMDLTSNRTNKQEAPIVGIYQDIAIGNYRLDKFYLRIDYEKLRGIEGGIIGFAGTGLAGIFIEYFDSASNKLGTTLLTHFEDSVFYNSFPFWRGPFSIESNNKLT